MKIEQLLKIAADAQRRKEQIDAEFASLFAQHKVAVIKGDGVEENEVRQKMHAALDISLDFAMEMHEKTKNL